MKIRILTPVQHDAALFQEGDVANIPDAAAKVLIDCGGAETIDAAAAKAAAKSKAEADATAQVEAEAEAAKKAAAEAAAAAGGNSDGNQG